MQIAAEIHADRERVRGETGRDRQRQRERDGERQLETARDS